MSTEAAQAVKETQQEHPELDTDMQNLHRNGDQMYEEMPIRAFNRQRLPTVGNAGKGLQERATPTNGIKRGKSGKAHTTGETKDKPERNDVTNHSSVHPAFANTMEHQFLIPKAMLPSSNASIRRLEPCRPQTSNQESPKIQHEDRRGRNGKVHKSNGIP